MWSALVPTSCRGYINDIDITNIVSRTGQLPLLATDLRYNDIDRRHQANRSMAMLNALHIMYLLITVLLANGVDQIGIVVASDLSREEETIS